MQARGRSRSNTAGQQLRAVGSPTENVFGPIERLVTRVIHEHTEMTHLEQVHLHMSGHGRTSDTNHESREGVEACSVAGWLRNSFLRKCSRVKGSSCVRCQPSTDMLGFYTHAHKASEPKHDLGRNRSVRSFEDDEYCNGVLTAIPMC